MDDIYEQAQAEFDKAAVRFTNEKAKLFRGDGSAVYADAVYEEKIAAITGELHAVADKLHNQAEAQIAEVRRRQEAEHDDPIGRLTTEEQAAASARAVFVKEDAMLLPLADLIKRLRGVSAAGKDKVNSYLWSRYARQRIEHIKTERGGRPSDDATRRQLTDLADAITLLEEGLGGKAKTPLEQAQASQRVADARNFQAKIGRAVRELDGGNERLKRELAARYGYF